MFLSIDIGGTKTLLALFSMHGICLKRLRFPTPKNPSAFITVLRENLDSLFKAPKNRSKLRAITVAIPGTIKFEQKNCSISCENLKWHNIDLLTPIKNLFNCKIFFANDANLATLYESTCLFKKSRKSVYLTFSTGIGGGISENGHLTADSDNFEPGHNIYSFNGKKLEWEDIASAKTLSSVYHSPLKSLKLTPEIQKDLISRLLPGLTQILKTESPDALIIGGPLGFIINKLKIPLLNALESSLKTSLNSLQIKRASRPTESTIYGAYLYSKINYKK